MTTIQEAEQRAREAIERQGGNVQGDFWTFPEGTQRDTGRSYGYRDHFGHPVEYWYLPDGTVVKSDMDGSPLYALDGKRKLRNRNLP
jgi:hypothetical protein